MELAPDTAADQQRRQAMARDQLGDATERVRSIMSYVPRHRFAPSDVRDEAYGDRPLPIGCGQTMSQPRMIAAMLDALELLPDQKVLDIGCGSGYVATLIAHLIGAQGMVHAAERHGELIELSRPVVAIATVAPNCAPVILHHADATSGMPDHAPFDRIHIACASDGFPTTILKQLAPGGVLIAPCGPADNQWLYRWRRDMHREACRRERLMPVRFVPMLPERD